MKLDYCQTHRGAPVEDAALPCLAIRHDDGRRATQRELWAELERLRAALLKVLDTRDDETKAWFTYGNAKAQVGGDAYGEARRYLRAMHVASNAEKEARLLLATMKTPSSDTERADAALQTAYAEGRKDERADWLPLLQAIQPLIEFNSSDEFITIRVRTADIAKARAAASYVKGS